MAGEDQVFRLVLLVGFLVVFPSAVYRRLKARAGGDRLDRRAEGPFIRMTLRPVAVIRIFGVLAYVADPAWMAWSSVYLPVALRWAGVIIGTFAAALLLIVFRNLGTNLTDTVVTRSRHTLVTSGPYRWVRHPFYSALALAVVADSLAAANWFLLLTGVVTIMLVVMRTRIEEEKLLERFGDEYRRYMARTGRFVPRLGRSVVLSS